MDFENKIQILMINLKRKPKKGGVIVRQYTEFGHSVIGLILTHTREGLLFRVAIDGKIAPLLPCGQCPRMANGHAFTRD